jgi:hypothetical protein
MSRRRTVLLALPVVLLFLAAAAATAAWFARPKKVALTVRVYGTDGLPLKCTAEVDGKTQDLTGTVPTELHFEGTRIVYTLTSTAEEGEFRVNPIIGGRSFPFSGSGRPPKNGVRSWVISLWGSDTPDYWIEPFDKEKNPAWLKAPPP